MKKMTVIVVALIGIGMTSCQKNYICECSYVTEMDGEILSESTITEEYTRLSKKHAQRDCDDYAKSMKSEWSMNSSFGLTTTGSCELK